MIKFFAILCIPAVAAFVILGLSNMESESETLARLAGQDQFISSLLK